ncbi:DUF4397 domain-containing protein [Actinocrinis puniceicyclus]|uniref:DUF4397 domain-containing protein n=1 Tax=Actinocrinis puniceicyclus TaxID=977794 RepID=A0A8J7WJL3_9ACTN|nr:DUF4397 domain-containing protein [Actinocrinis puniceicyclus]MBS2963493.1 DUF4397 domain-containing protein [Actinocrinis puniceicyclus]
MRIRIRRVPAVAAAVLIACAAVAARPAAASADATSTLGWIRLAHLAPGMPPVDLYLSPANSPGAQSGQSVLPHLAYGTVSPYQTVKPGDYIVAMRSAGNAASADPVTTAQVTVTAGQAYTVAAIGPPSVVKLQVLTDQLTAPAGRSAVRAIEASQHDPTVSIAVGDGAIAPGLRFPTIAAYQSVGSGAAALLVTPPGGSTQTVSVTFAPNSTYTVLVLDGAGGVPQVVTVADASGMSAIPQGGVNTGFGGTRAGAAGAGMAQEHGYSAPAVELAWVFSLISLLATVQVRRHRRARIR